MKNLSKPAEKLYQQILKNGFFRFDTEENVLSFLHEQALQKKQYKKATLLRELMKSVYYY